VEYVLVSQSARTIERFVRRGPNEWLYESFDASSAPVVLASVPAALSIDEVYEGVEGLAIG
jgi:hypothetical protein